MHFNSRFAINVIGLAKTGREMEKTLHNPDDSAHSDILEKLERVRSIIDGKFVAACEILPQSLEGIRGLSASLDRLAATFDAEITATTRAELTLAAAKLCSLPASEAKQANTLDRLSRSIEKLGRHIGKMRKSLTVMKYQVGDGSASGGVDAGDLVAQIYAQSSRSCTELHAFEAELALLKRELGLAAVQGQIRNRQMATLIPAVPDQLAATTHLLNDRYKAVVATAEKVSAVICDIRHRLDHLLTSLQIGDITRQRIEHIMACIAKMNADIARQPRAIRRRFEATCYALIARHIEQIEKDFTRQTGVIEDQMAEMATNTAQLLKLHEVAFDRHDGGNASFLHDMASRLDTALGLVAPIEAADMNALATERAMIQTALELGGHVERIQVLREAICAKVTADGPNAGSTETNANSRVLKHNVHIGLAALDEVMALAGNITTVANTDRDLDSKATSAASALANAAKRVHKAKDITETDLDEVVAEGETVVGMLKMKTSQLCLRLEVGEVLALAAAEAAALGEDAYDPDDQLPDALVRTLTGIFRFYTMTQERNLHRAFLTAYAIPCAEPSPLNACDEADAILF
jgi:hypothetical protein